MRFRLLLAVVPSLVACGAGPAPCTVESCAQVCALQGVVASADASFIPAHILYPDVAAVLRPEIDDLRAGVVVEPAASGVCGGAAGDCAGFFPTPAVPVAPGTHRLVVTHRTPRLARDGDWKWVLDERCTVEVVSDGVAVPTIEPRSATGLLESTEGRMERLVVAEVAAPAERARTCAWTVRFDGPEGRVTEASGAYAVPASPTSSPPAPATPPAGAPTPADAP